MALLKYHELVSDLWTLVDGTDDPSNVDHPIITAEAWDLHRVLLGRGNAPLGILLKSDQSPVGVANYLDRFNLIALDFPTVADGRAFSYARLLRDRYGYKGEVRAVGEVRRDQYLFMLRCGFDAFVVDDTVDPRDWRQAASEVSVFYEPGSDNVPWSFRRRNA